MKFADAPIPRDQINLIPTYLDELLPQNSPIRLVDELLDQLDWTVFNEKFRYEHGGRPPIAPRILVAIWIWAFFRRVRSSRELEYQLRTNVEFMWLAHGHRLDHSTLAAFRSQNAKPLKEIHRDLIRLAENLLDEVNDEELPRRWQTCIAAKLNLSRWRKPVGRWMR